MAINLRAPQKPQPLVLPQSPVTTFQSPVEDFLAPFHQNTRDLTDKIAQISNGNNNPVGMTPDTGVPLTGGGSQLDTPTLPTSAPQDTPYQAYAGKVDEKLNALPWYDPTKYVGKGIMALSDTFSQKNDQGQPTGVPSEGLQAVSDTIKPITDEGVGNFIARKGQDIGNNMGNSTVWDSTTLKDKVQKLIDKNPGITDDEITAVMKNLKDNHNYVFSDNPLVKANSYIPTLGSVGSAIVKSVTSVAGGGTQNAMDFVSGMNNLDPHLNKISDAEANSQMVNSGLGVGMAGLGVAFPGATAAFNSGFGEDIMGGKIPFVGKSVNDLNSMAGKWGLDTFTNLDPNSQEYKNYHSALEKILPIVATVGAGKAFKGGKSAIFGEDMNYQNGTVGDFVKSTGKTVDDFSSAMSELRPNTAGKFTESTKISDIFSPEEFAQLDAMAKQSGTPMRKEGMISDATQAKVGEKVGEFANSAVDAVKGAKMPDLHIKSSVGNAFSGLKDYLTGLDEKTKTAIKNTSPEEMNSIISNAKESIGKQGDYVQTPYHKGAEKAQETLKSIDSNLGKRQEERMAMLDESSVPSINLDNSRQSLQNSLRSMNVDNISVKDGEAFIKPIEGRESMFQSDNPSDVKAIEKIQEILQDNVSPTQTMDRVRKLQEWVYENKTRIGFKGISDKMETVLSKVQTSMNKTFKEQMPPEYAQVMDSMSEDMRLKNDIKRQFGIDEFGNPAGNRGELVMKRLANGTTTSGEARTLALKIKEKYGIDLIKEARLRQMAMDLVGDERGSTLFGAIARGKRGIINYAIEKSLGKLVNKEKVIRKLAMGRKETPKKQEPIYTPNSFKKAMAQRAKMEQRLLPEASGKATGARNFRVNQKFDNSATQRPGINFQRPGGSQKTKSAEMYGQEAIAEKERTVAYDRMVENFKNSIASDTKAARYGGTGNTRVETKIKDALGNGTIDRSTAYDIVTEIIDDSKKAKIDKSYREKYSYIDSPKLEKFLNDIYESKIEKPKSFEDILAEKSNVTGDEPKKDLTPKAMFDEINQMAHDRRYATETVNAKIEEFKTKTGADPYQISFDNFQSDGTLKSSKTQSEGTTVVIEKPKTEVKTEVSKQMSLSTNNTEAKPSRGISIGKKESVVSKKEITDTMTTAEKIQAELDNKQASRDFKDVSERVAGSRKEKALYRKLSIEDYKKVESESAALANDLVTKDRVIENKYDPSIDKESGIPAGVVYLKEKLLSSITKKPDTGKEFRETYVQDVPEIYQKIADAKTLKEIKDIGNEYFKKRFGMRTDTVEYITDGKPMAEGVFGKKFLDTISQRTDGAKTLWSDAEMKNGLTSEQLQEKRSEYLKEIDQQVVSLEKKFSETDWNSEAKRRMPGNLDAFARLTESKFKPSEYRNQDPKIVKVIAEYLKKRGQENVDTHKEAMIKNFDSKAVNQVRNHDWSYLSKETKTAPKQEKSDTPALHGGDTIVDITRKGGRDVTVDEVSSPEKVKELFGYKSTQFGNYMKDTDSKKSIENFIGAMKDLEDITGLDIKKLNEREGLSIAFGARGSGKFAAHYEPHYNIINLTKGHGNGSVAHEFGHFLDWTAGKVFGLKEGGFPDALSNEKVPVKSRFFMGRIQNEEPTTVSAPLKDAMFEVIKAIKGEGGTHEKSVKFRPDESSIVYPSLKRMYEEKGLSETLEYLKQRKYKETDLIKYYKYIAKLHGSDISVEMKSNGTRYYSDSSLLGKKYWGSNVELFARAFEAYIQDLGMEKGIESNYLVADNNYPRKTKKYGDLHTYPLGTERALINQKIDIFMKELIKEGGKNK